MVIALGALFPISDGLAQFQAAPYNKGPEVIDVTPVALFIGTRKSEVVPSFQYRNYPERGYFVALKDIKKFPLREQFVDGLPKYSLPKFCDPCIALSDIGTVDEDQQTFELHIRPHARAMEPQTLNLAGRSRRSKPLEVKHGREPASIFNLTLLGSAGSNQDERYGGILQSIVGLGRFGTLNSTVDWTSTNETLRRQATFLRLDDIERRSSVQIGETGTAGGNYGLNARILGLRYQSDPTSDPDFRNDPELDLALQAVAPSTVDVFVDGFKRRTKELNAGRIELGGLTSQGIQDVEIVVTDILGNRRVINERLFGGPGLLPVGYTDFDLSAGLLASDATVSGLEYSTDFAAGVRIEHGLYTALTVGYGATWLGDLARAGASFTAGGRLGLVDLTVLAQESDGRAGWRTELNWQDRHRLGRFQVRLDASYFLGERFNDPGSVANKPTGGRISATLSGFNSSLGVSYYDINDAQGGSIRFESQYDWLEFGASASRLFGSDFDTAKIFLRIRTVPLATTFTAEQSDSIFGQVSGFDLSSSITDIDTSLGLNVQIPEDDLVLKDTIIGSIIHQGQTAHASYRFEQVGNQSTHTGRVSSAFYFDGYNAGISRPINLGEGLVTVDAGKANIPIKIAGITATTNDNGRTTLPVRALRPADILVQSLDLPEGYYFEQPKQRISVMRGHAVQVQMLIKLPGVFLHIADIPSGSQFRLNGKTYETAKDGVYIDNLTDGRNILELRGQSYALTPKQIGADLPHLLFSPQTGELTEHTKQR